MRITFATVNRNVQRNLSRRYSDLVGYQEQLATGKRLRKASDDPVDVANTIKLRAKEVQLGQYKRNIQDGLAVMGVAASAMASMNDILHRTRELAVQAANGTYNDNDRMYMQQEVDQLYRQMMSVVNTKFKGTYIFNGTNGNVPPYKIASSGCELTDYNNRTMATFGTVFARKFDGNDWNTPNIPDPAVATGATHAFNGDTLYLNYASSHLRIGDKVQLTWDSPTDASDVEGRKLQYIFPETFPLDSIDVRVTENGVIQPPQTFTNGTTTLPTFKINTLSPPTQLTNPSGGIIQGSVKVTVNGGVTSLIEGKDYSVDYDAGMFRLLNSYYLGADFDIKFKAQGARVDYEVDYVTGQVSILSEEFRDALNKIPNSDRKAQTAISFDTGLGGLPGSGYNANGLIYRTDNKFQIVEGKLGDSIRDIFPGSMKIKIGNKEYLEGHGEYQPDYYDENGVLQKGKNKYDYEVDYETGIITVYNPDLMRDMRPDWLGGPSTLNAFTSTISGITDLSQPVPIVRYPNTSVLTGEFAAPPMVTVNGVVLTLGTDYTIGTDPVTGAATFSVLPGSPYNDVNTQFKIEYSLNPPPNMPENMYKANQLQITFDYITRGVDIYGDRVTSKGDILRIIEDGIVVPINIGADALLKDDPSGNDMVGTLLRYSQALLKDDRDGIQRALDELTTMYDAVLNSQSQMGAKIYRLELTEQRNGEQSIEVGQQVSSLADADLAEVISRLMLAESVYNAALQAAMRVLQPSLANYM